MPQKKIGHSYDNGKNWTKPVILGTQKGGQINYPYLFERYPGEIWIIAGISFRKNWEQPFAFKVKKRKGLCKPLLLEKH
ncbi:MAG TPA: hypothetical protein P5025_01005 [Candidatus Ratteibacteria bacterium]|nr:hypothetical protein [Candidatus Ratteibacteria bacterium]